MAAALLAAENSESRVSNAGGNLKSRASGFIIACAGRLLASLSPLTPSDALRLAARLGSGRYIAITGGVDAVEAFEDENHRPLVYRRERVLIDDGGAWREIDRAVRSVPFSISDATGAIAIDAAALDDGLIVVVRQWEGSVAELRDARRDFADASSRDLVGQLAASDPQRGAREGGRLRGCPRRSCTCRVFD